MSIFSLMPLPCPECGRSVDFQAVHSVNADRRPDLREAILQRRFQRQECPGCGNAFRLDPAFTYIDLRRGQWIAAHPMAELGDWQAQEEKVRALFAQTYGPAAPKAVQRMGAKLAPRLVFGWSALREKIVAMDAGLDDRVVELVKLTALRHSPGAPFDPAASVRLLHVQPHRLLLGWVRNFDDGIGDLRWVERALYDDLATDAARGAASDYAEPLAAWNGALFVDIDRLMVQPQAVA